MATFKCDNCGELNHDSQKITDNDPRYINKFVQLIALFMPGSGGSHVGWVTCDPRVAIAQQTSTAWVQEPTLLIFTTN